ncbi:MAG: hypothetical protein AB7U45_03805 [Desulfamplus sp.]
MSRILNAAAEQLSYSYDETVSLLALPIEQRKAIDERLEELYLAGYYLKITQSAYSKATNIVYLTMLARKDFNFTCPVCGEISSEVNRGNASYRCDVFDAPVFYYDENSEKKHMRVNIIAPQATLKCANSQCSEFNKSKSIASWWKPTLIQARRMISTQTVLTQAALDLVLDICLENSFILTAPNKHIIKQICRYIALPEKKAVRLLSRPAFEKMYIEKRKELYCEVY